MKKAVVIISIFLSACGGAATEAITDTAAVYVDTRSSQSSINVNKFNVTTLVGKYNYYKQKLIGGYKISGDNDLTLKEDFSYKLFVTYMDEYNDNELKYNLYEGRYSYDGFNTIEFIDGNLGERGAKIYLSESNLNGNLDQITITFSSGRGDAMYFNRIIENQKPIFTAENVKQPTSENVKQPTSSSSIDKSVASIIGKPFKISNLEVVQKDFPNVMNWNDAKEACTELGDGWRLPTKDELNILFNNKDKIGGFAGGYYWSSNDYGYDGAWVQMFNGGYQFGSSKKSTYSVRAIRAF